MKKCLSILLVGLLCVHSVTAITWAGLVDNNTKITSDFSDVGLNQANGIYLSIASPVTKSGTVNFAAEGLYKYNLNKNGDDLSFTNILDIDLLKLSGKWNVATGSINLSAGRFSYSDASGVVYSQTSDGLYVAYNSNKIKTAAYAGYTGLLNSLNVSMTAPAAGENEQIYNLCAGYIPLGAEFAYSALFGMNTLGLQVMYFINFDDAIPSNLYGTLALNGPITTLGFYSFVMTLGTEEFENVMLYSKLNCSFFMKQSGILSAGLEYASGEQFGLSSFTTISASNGCSLGGGVPMSGIIAPFVSFGYVKNNLYVSFNEKLVCLMPEEDVSFEGFDTTLGLIVNVLSDVQVGCDANLFIDLNSSDLNYFSGTIKASLAF